MSAYRWRGIDPDTGTDYDAERFDDARERLQGDGDEWEAVVKTVMASNQELLQELCSGAYTADGAADAGRQLAQAADAEWDRRARQEIDSLDEEAALSRAGL